MNSVVSITNCNGRNFARLDDGRRDYLYRVIMEKEIGRKLEKREQVHHIDGNKRNDSIDNLEILDIAEHAKLHVTGKTFPNRWKHFYVNCLCCNVQIKSVPSKPRKFCSNECKLAIKTKSHRRRNLCPHCVTNMKMLKSNYCRRCSQLKVNNHARYG